MPSFFFCPHKARVETVDVLLWFLRTLFLFKGRSTAARIPSLESPLAVHSFLLWVRLQECAFMNSYEALRKFSSLCLLCLRPYPNFATFPVIMPQLPVWWDSGWGRAAFPFFLLRARLPVSVHDFFFTFLRFRFESFVGRFSFSFLFGGI
eukprot:RCo001872